MKKYNLFNYLLLAICPLFAVSCGVEHRLVEVQALSPAVSPTNFSNKDFAIFTSLYALGTPEDYVLRNDSLLMNEVAVGMKETFEKSVLFSDYDIPIYNLYFYHSREDSVTYRIDASYLQSLLEETGSRAFVIIHSLDLEPFQTMDRQYDDRYGYFYYGATRAPFEMAATLFDMDSITPVSDRREYADTLIWGYSDYNLQDVQSSLLSLEEANYAAAYEIGTRYANRFVPYWENIRRFYFVASSADWRTAARYVDEYNWQGAVDLWAKYTGSENSKIASYAAFNTAFGCEMLGFYDLSMEWLTYAKSKYYFGFIDGYQDIIRKRQEESSRLQKQLLPPE